MVALRRCHSLPNASAADAACQGCPPRTQADDVACVQKSRGRQGDSGHPPGDIVQTDPCLGVQSRSCPWTQAQQFVTLGSEPTVPSNLWVLVSTLAPGLVSAQVSSASQLSRSAPPRGLPCGLGGMCGSPLSTALTYSWWGALRSRRHMSVVWWVALRVHCFRAGDRNSYH